MLVLSRKRSQGILFDVPGGSQMRIVVVEIRGDKVRIGIDAPRAIQVVRDDAKCTEDRHAATP